MSLPKLFFFGAVGIFAIIAIFGLMKKPQKKEELVTTIDVAKVEEVVIDQPIKEEAASKKETVAYVSDEESHSYDHVEELFSVDSLSPIVETITYTSRVPWLTGRPAWVADYASHFETSRHFIARSLNGKIDYQTQKISPGDRFNVLKKDIEFRLIVDLSEKKLYFYAFDTKQELRYLLKTYPVAIGRKDPKKASGCHTPLGKYALGSKVAIYKPGVTGYFQDRQIEMIRVFGTRWIPLGQEISGCSEIGGKKKLGLHGAPWVASDSGELVEDRECIGKNVSDGSIRLQSEDIEELFAIVITKPTVVEVVKSLKDVELPGKEADVN